MREADVYRASADRRNFQSESSAAHVSFMFKSCTGVMLMFASPLCAIGQSTPAGHDIVPSSTAARQAILSENYGKLPLSFERNMGQSDRQVKFLSRGNGYSLFLTDKEAVLALHKSASAERDQPVAASGGRHGDRRKPSIQADVVGMQLQGATRDLRVSGEEQLQSTVNYFIGNDPKQWHSSVPTFGKVKYANVYPGVDLVYYGNQQQLEYDFVVAPNADTKPIRLRFDGAKKLKLDASGDLKIVVDNGEIAFHKPVVYQETNGQRRLVDGRFAKLAGNTIGFALGDYDHNSAVVIDPTLAYSTYLGGDGGIDGSFTDNGSGIAVDASGNAYVVGYTWSVNFPITSGSFKTKDPGAVYSDFVTSVGFITKVNPTGTALVYSTYIGGSGSSGNNGNDSNAGGGDGAAAIAVDSAGNAYVTGTTWSSNFPTTTGAIQTENKAFPTGYNAWIAKLNASGTGLVYSTYLGGTGYPDSSYNGYGDGGATIAVDKSGDAYVAGPARSRDFPTTTGAFQRVNNAAANYGTNAWAAKLNATGTALIYSTYLGGSGNPLYAQFIPLDAANGIDIDSSGDAYLTGMTVSSDFPHTSGAYQTVNKAAPNNLTTGFVTELNPSGSGLIFSTLLGGSGTLGATNGTSESGLGDVPYAIRLNASNDAFITGATGSSDYPYSSGAFQTVNKGVSSKLPNGFVTKLNPTGSALLYSTLLGGSGDGVDGDRCKSITLDGSGNAYVTGYTNSPNFPVTSGAYQSTNSGATNLAANAFLTEVNPSGTALVYSTYVGGSGNTAKRTLGASGDVGSGIGIDASGGIYLVGTTYSHDFPITPGAFQAQNNGYSGGNSNLFVSKFNFGSSPSLIETTTTLTAAPDPGTVGARVTFTAAVEPCSGAVLPTGTVTFTVDNGAGTAETLDDTCHATYATSSLAIGTHTIDAGYSGDANYAPSSGTASETINAPQVATPIISPASGIYTSPVTVTITDSTTGATIHYTADGTSPTISSPTYTVPILVSSTETIEAIAIASGDANSAVASATYTISPKLQFIPVTPCRIADTRNAAGAFGGPELAAAAIRTFDIPQSTCGIPSTAAAYSLNVTVVPPGALSYLTIWPAGQEQPTVSTLNSDGRVKANAAITPAGTNGGVSVYASDATQFILDIDGYFVPAGTSASGLDFYPLTPCRIADTRNAAGSLGGPSLTGGVGRTFPVQSSACDIPSTAKAYSLNITAVPHGVLGFLTTWPTGQPQPVVSTLNSSTGAVTANAAIVPAGSEGEISIFVSDTADAILDVNGYFAPPATGGLSLYTVPPCRVLDTRNGSGAMDGTLTVPVHASPCAPAATAQAYVLNATVVPPGPLSYLTLWAAGGTQPDVSTLNANDGAVTSNMAIVPTSNGSIDAFSTDPTQLILDLSSYFAP